MDGNLADNYLIEERVADDAELRKFNERVSQLEAELRALEAVKRAYATQLAVEKSKITLLECQNATLKQALTDTTHCKVSGGEAETLCGGLNIGLLCQSQVEDVVNANLQNCNYYMAMDMEAIEAELQVKEKYLREKAINQCRSFADSHKAEITKMEAEFQKETELLKEKLQESEKRRKMAVHRLQEETKRRTQTALQLYSVVGEHWREAMNIILRFVKSGTHSKPRQGKNNKNAHSDARNRRVLNRSRKKTEKDSDVVPSIATTQWRSRASESVCKDDILLYTRENCKRLSPKEERVFFIELGDAEGLTSSWCTAGDSGQENEPTTSESDQLQCSCSQKLLLVLPGCPEDNDETSEAGPHTVDHTDYTLRHY